MYFVMNRHNFMSFMRLQKSQLLTINYFVHKGHYFYSPRFPIQLGSEVFTEPLVLENSFSTMY